MDNGRRVGVLSRDERAYRFRYDDAYLATAGPPISLSLPTTRQEYVSNYLFPFFSGLLAEGTNKSMQIRLLHLEEGDEFTRLLETAESQTIGAITVRKLPD
ncbi:HipA N-terminal domain-containing protein [Hymenobacter sp. BT189]|uniref:HipA N-terminal domain-containing protein n=1 Tax=Hymenobacter armeniacus TaxID=2771358 RepID=A0ABR8JUW3_9BACT|nr:HipA N-terminal domain-containing protein [Hymenobacter armeniacus]